jgi:membrane protease YdiL (CAAX protease family)
LFRYPAAVPHSTVDRPFHPRSGATIWVGLMASIVLPALVGAVFLANTDYDTTSPTGTGAYVGRVGAQTQVIDVTPTALGLPLWAVTLLQIPLWISLLAAVWIAAGRRADGLVDRLGFSARRGDAPAGLLLGVVTQLVFVPLLYAVIFWFIGDRDVSSDARALTDRADSIVGVALLLVGVGLVAPVVEELFFRGLAQATFERSVGRWAGLLAAAVLFAVVHFQVLQFPALLLFGLIAGGLFQRQGRLGGAIWTHVGFNLTTLVVLLFVV